MRSFAYYRLFIATTAWDVAGSADVSELNASFSASFYPIDDKRVEKTTFMPRGRCRALVAIKLRSRCGDDGMSMKFSFATLATANVTPSPHFRNGVN